MLLHINIEESHVVLKYLNKFRKLRELEVHVIDFEDSDEDKVIVEQTQESIITLARNLSSLKRFGLHGIQLMESSVIKFAYFPNNLRELKIHDCRIKFAEDFFLELAEVLKSSKMENKNKPLKLLIDSMVNFEAIQKVDIKNYLRIFDE